MPKKKKALPADKTFDVGRPLSPAEILKRNGGAEFTRVSAVAKYRPKGKDLLFEPDGELLRVHFEYKFGDEKYSKFDVFNVKKTSCKTALADIAQYLNYFANLYDPDDEYIFGLFKIKYEIDGTRSINADTVQLLKDYIYAFIFTPSMQKKIYTIVEENYFDDIEKTDTQYEKNGKYYLESLEFTNEHIKILLRVSMGIKLMLPILVHYIDKCKIKLTKDSPFLFNFYEPLLTMFSSPDVDIYNKLFIYVKRKVMDAQSRNKPIYEKNEIFGHDDMTLVDRYLKYELIGENFFKFKFSESIDPKTGRYRENILGLIKTIIKIQLVFFRKNEYSKNLAEVTNAKNGDELSGADKLEMNLSKIDEGLLNLADENISRSIEFIRDNINMKIPDEEIDYMIQHQAPSGLQVTLVRSYFGKYFGEMRDLNLLTRREFIILELLLKRILLVESGETGEDGYMVSHAVLPYILTGNVSEKVNTRVIRNQKFSSKIEESYLYHKLIDQKYSYLNSIRENIILQMLSALVNTNFTYVTYENQELTGNPIVYSDDQISDELLFFLNSI